uniref:Uncharacterized protein n=1 Tax=Lepeophtheirus salmonis TaxID=72036 RepID=A0A0K2TI82_LEPSM
MDSNYNFNACLDRKIHQKLMKIFQCSVPFVRDTDVICISKNKSFQKNLMQLYNRYYKLKQIVLCGPPCSTLDIFSGMPHRSVHKDPHQSYMKLYMKTTIRVKTSIIDYSADTMLGEIGGSTGLLLGISLMKSGIKIKRWIMGNEDE